MAKHRKRKSPDSQPEIELESRAGTNRPRQSVVSVAFPREDFIRVAHVAEQRQMKLSEFIRSAAITAASDATRTQARITSISSSPAFTNVYQPAGESTSTARSEVREPTCPNYSST
jgi:hypothetical protein